MRKWIAILFFLPGIIYGQYRGERALEKSFENSRLYFNSHYLNTFGLQRFKNVAVGLVNDPFLNLYLNPAILPKLERDNMLYLDFRGDRTDTPIINSWVEPGGYTYDYRPGIYPDPRWYSQARGEPEPLFSLGIFAYPFPKRLKNLFVGATYQLIHKQEKFYQVPAWIYSSRLGYDAFGAEAANKSDIPIQERSVGADEMLNEAHLFTAHLGYRLSPKLSAGISLNGVNHSRDGEYLQIQNDEYGNIDNNSWKYHNQRTRNQNYDHLDVAGGIRYQPASDFFAGIKIGQLKGNADQDFFSVDSSHYRNNQPNVSPEWSYSLSRSVTTQEWRHQGTTRYGRVSLGKKLKSGQEWKFYYRYAQKNVDYSNRSAIEDTSFYSSRWVWNNQSQEYLSHSSLTDTRHGSGTRKTKIHEAMLNFHWKLTRKNFLNAGIYYSRENTLISGEEPVLAKRHSFYKNTGQYPREDVRLLVEDKNLDWQYQATKWSIQIPVLLDFRLSEQWGVLLGVNKSLVSWDIRDRTIAYFSKREKLENKELNSETNFGELYKEPDKKISEDYTDVIARFEVKISPQFRIHLLIDPEFEDHFRIAQWWLGFRSNL